MLTSAVLFIAGLGSLLAGAHALTKGAARLASLLRIPALWIGFVLVAIGTSLPELVVSLIASWREESDLVLATIIGSNAANLGLILAIGLFIRPFHYSQEETRRYGQSMLMAGALLGFLSLDGLLSQKDGLILLSSGILLLGSSWKKIVGNPPKKATVHTRSLFIDIVWIICGILALWIGGHILVDTTLELARAWNIREELLGLSLIAIGTSLPELITTVVATYKHQSDIALGNLLGSNTVNILFILGITLLLHPLKLSPMLLQFDVPTSLILTSLTTWLLMQKKTLHRTEGILLFTLWSALLVLGAWLRT